MFNWKDISMAGLILLAIVFYTCKKNTIQTTIFSPENKASNYITNDEVLNDTLFKKSTKLITKHTNIINWVSFEEAYNMCKQNPKPIIIDIYSSNCSSCKLMTNETFNNTTIANYINENYYAVKFDAFSLDTVKFANYTFVKSENTSSTHQFVKSILDNQLTYPSIVFLNNQIQRLDIIKCFLSPKEFEPIINYYGSGIYQNKKWPEFLSKFNSNIK